MCYYTNARSTNDLSTIWRVTQEVEEAPLLREQGCNRPREFESLTLRQKADIYQLFCFIKNSKKLFIF